MSRWRFTFLFLLMGLAGCRAEGSPPATEPVPELSATAAAPTPTAEPSVTPTPTLTPTPEPTGYLAPTPHTLQYLINLGITINIPERKTDPYGSAITSDNGEMVCWFWPVILFDPKNSNKGRLCVTYDKTTQSLTDYPATIKQSLASMYSGVEDLPAQDFTTYSGVEGKKVAFLYMDTLERICAYYLFAHEWRGILLFEFCRFEAVKQGPNSTDDIDPEVDGIVRSMKWLYDKQFFFGQ